MELDRLVPSPGNLWIAGQQVWPGPAMTGRTVRLWAGLKQVRVLLGGHRIKDPAVPARCPRPGPPRRRGSSTRRAAAAAPGIRGRDRGRPDRGASGSVSLGDHIISAGLPLAGQRVTLRPGGPVARILAGGVLARTVA